MAAIGRIRKHGVALMIIIGIALLAFIVGDLTNVINPMRNRLVKIGDKTITMSNHENEYGTNYNQNRKLFELINPNATNDEEFDQGIHDFTWQQIKNETLLDAQLKEVGLVFSKEMRENLNEQLSQSLKAQPTTQAEYYLYLVAQRFVQNGASVDQIIGAFQNINDYVGQDIYDIYKAIERIAVISAKENAYFGLANNSVYFSEKLLNQMAKDDSAITTLMAGLSIDNPAFDKVKVEVSESEAKAYFKEHKARYTVHEAVRDIDFVVIPVSASEQDNKCAADTVTAIFNRFQNCASIGDFAKKETRIDRSRVFSLDAASSNASNIFHYNYKTAHYAQVDTMLYLKKGETAMKKYSGNDVQNVKSLPAQLDSFIYSHPAGTFIAPTMLDGIYYFGKIRGFASRPDSIQVAALSVAYKCEMNDKATLTKEQAQELADSLMTALNAGESIYSLYASHKSPYLGADSTLWLTDMPGDTVYNKLYSGLMNTGVNQFYTEERESYGFITIFQVLDKTNAISKAQYVLYPVPIQPSLATDKSAKAKATEIAGKSTDVEAMSKVAKENAFDVLSQAGLTNMQGVIYLNYDFQGNPYSGLMCRQAISWAFDDNDDANNAAGQVSRTIFKGKLFHYEAGAKVIDADAYIVAGVKAIVDAKKPSFEGCKARVMADLKAEKKVKAVEELIQKELATASIDAVAAKYQARVDTTVINFSQYGRLESAVVGKLAALPADGKAHVLTGENAVYLVAVQSVKANENTANTAAYESAAYLTSLNKYFRSAQEIPAFIQQSMYNDMMKDTKIVDRRHIYYKSN